MTGEIGNELFRDEVELFAERLAALRASRTSADTEVLLAELDLAQEELRVADEEVRAQQDELTDLVHAYEVSRLAHERLLAALPLPVLATDLHGGIRSANAAAADLMGLPVHRLVGKPLFSFVDVSDRQPLRQGIAELSLGARNAFHATCTLRVRTGRAIRAHLAGSTTGTTSPTREEVTWLVTGAEETREEQAAGSRLATALVDLTRLPLDSTDTNAVLTRVAATCQRALPDPVAVSVTIGCPAAPTMLATDSQLAQDLDGAQIVSGEGPCLEAWTRKEMVRSTSLAEDPRWPRLGKRAADTVVGAAVAEPIRVAGEVVGVLNVYGEGDGFVADEQAGNVDLLATAAGAVLQEVELRLELETVAHQLEQALESRATIDQAKGMVMAAYGCGPDDAFKMLVRASNSTNMKLRDLAAKLVEDASAGKSLGSLRGAPGQRR